MSLCLGELRYSSARHSIPVTQVFKKPSLSSGLLICWHDGAGQPLSSFPSLAIHLLANSVGTCPWPVRAYGPVRGRPWKADGPHTAPTPRTPSAICPWTPQHSALQRYKMTRRRIQKKRPASARFRS